jgi:hypothetical protein
MQYLKEAKKRERNENYAHLVGELRKRVHMRVNDLLGMEDPKGPSRQDIKLLILEELQENGVTQELEWYAEGFVRGLSGKGSAYYARGEGMPTPPGANKHTHLGYSAGMHLRRIRDLEGKVTRLKK